MPQLVAFSSGAGGSMTWQLSAFAGGATGGNVILAAVNVSRVYSATTRLFADTGSKLILAVVRHVIQEFPKIWATSHNAMDAS